MSLPFDATMKEVIGQRPDDFAEIFNLPRILPAVPLNIDLSTISAASDAAIGFGDPIREIVDLNFQSGPDADLVARLHLYNAALHLRFGVPVRTLLILLRPKAETPGIDGRMTYAAGGKRVEFEYDAVRMWEQPVERFLAGAVGILPLAILCRMPPGKPLSDALRDVVCEIDRRLASEIDNAMAVRLMTAAFVLTGLRTRKQNLERIYKGVRVMHDSTAFDYYVDQGLKRGRKEGRKEGELSHARRLLLIHGRKKLGEVSPLVEKTIREIDDVGRLERMFEETENASSWDELLAVP